ncbi:TetR/AcrR family transcriptional regulator [bacterium]|nr:TetR/AcrR family transcriptional regulator [bacterium]
MDKKPSPVRTPAKADDTTREQLLDAATTLFAEHGIAATTIAQIAAHVGVTSAMVHYYFKTRDHLLDAIVEERIMHFTAIVWGSFTGSEADPISLVKGLVAQIIKACEIMPWLPPLWIREIVNEGGMLREKTMQHISFDRQKKFVECITAGQNRGEVNMEIDPRLLYMSIIGLTLLPLAAAKIWNRIPILEGLGKDDLARHVTALLMHGLANPRPNHNGNHSNVDSM